MSRALLAYCTDEKLAVEFMEKQRWGECASCPCCASLNVYQMRSAWTGERQKNFRWRCKDCKKQFTAKTGTFLDNSRIMCKYWLFAFYAISINTKPTKLSGKKLKRQTNISDKSCFYLLKILYRMIAGEINDDFKLLDFASLSTKL